METITVILPLLSYGSIVKCKKTVKWPSRICNLTAGSLIYLQINQWMPLFALIMTGSYIFQMNGSHWANYCSFSSYQAEIARNHGALSHPDEIRFIQQALKETVNKDLSIDGHWGQQTDNALIKFQRQNGLYADGVLGPKTASKLKEMYEQARILSVPES